MEGIRSRPDQLPFTLTIVTMSHLFQFHEEQNRSKLDSPYTSVAAEAY
jgi:hypothetical protein